MYSAILVRTRPTAPADESCGCTSVRLNMVPTYTLRHITGFHAVSVMTTGMFVLRMISSKITFISWLLMRSVMAVRMSSA